jgi:purine-binding chemotaxis protein CheW
MTKKRTPNDLPIPPDLVGSSGPAGSAGADEWDQLFNPEAGADPMVLAHAEVAEEDEAPPVSTRFLGFRLGQEYYAVPILHLSEVVRYQEITAVPRVRRFVRGIISVRGTIVPIVDLRRRLSQQPDEGTSAPAGTAPTDDEDPVRWRSNVDRRVLITRHGGEVFGLLVDEVSDVFVADPADIEPPPATLPRRLLEFVSGIARVQGRIHTVLEVSSVLRFSAVDPAFRGAEVVP